MAYARIARITQVSAAVCGAAHAAGQRAYAIRPYIYTICNQKTTHIVYIIPQTPNAVAFPNNPKIT